MPNEDKFKALVGDLGKSTLRGVRKCPKCGVYNGIRGLCCKNKACDAVFKEAGEKRKQHTEVARLVTGNSTQIFSVRVRAQGPDYRGFVQLPLLQPALDTDGDAAIIDQTTALCFVDCCQRTFNTNLKCHEKEFSSLPTCLHIQAALRCCTHATPIMLHNPILWLLNVKDDIKQEIVQLTSESAGPLVQRVSKTIMAVKCKVTSKNPLGYLHVTITSSRGKELSCNCTCPAFNKVSGLPCTHIYACAAAFMGDAKLSDEFVHFVERHRIEKNLLFELDNNDSLILRQEEDEISEESQNNLVAILSDMGGDRMCEVEVKVMSEDGESFLNNTNLIIPELVESPLITETIEQIEGLADSEVILQVDKRKPKEKRKRDDLSMFAPLEDNIPSLHKKFINPRKLSTVAPDESTESLSFIEWLASVTERINQTMHYQFDGNPQPLVFQTPQGFFECLRERINQGGPKKRLPNNITAFVRKTSIPLGLFTKYTWHINNIIHVKQIFETSLMSLNITRSFIQNQDGTYDPFDFNVEDRLIKVDSNPRIRPIELKTFMKVGLTLSNQIVPTPFIIEWIPEMLPVSKVGELRITFQYGHSRPNNIAQK